MKFANGHSIHEHAANSEPQRTESNDSAARGLAEMLCNQRWQLTKERVDSHLSCPCPGWRGVSVA